ncbi:MAG: hypothetical protein GXP27_03660, partial [Planctomycetes bacterium]|nr:hypothetical protein [Planctomycetota bacterium]
PAGGVFRIELTRMDTPPHGLEPALDEAEWTARVLGRSPGPVAIDCYDFWPHRQAYRFEMPPLRNPAPGQMARIRFTCMGKQRESRGYLLAIDQIGLDPAPLAPEDWHALETTVVVRHDAHLSVAPMAIGRSDFYGWGGLQLTASRPGRAVICLSAPVASPQAQAIELRGVVEQGDWRIQFTGWPGILARPASSHDKPTVWTIPLPEPLSAPCTLQLEIVAAARVESKAAPSHRRSKRESRLLLDAWRFLPQSPPKQRQR